MGEETWHAIVLVLIMVLVLVAAYYTTRFLAKVLRPTSKEAQIQLLDQLYLGKDKMILVVKVGDKGHVVGVTSQSMTALDVLDKEALDALQANSQRLKEDRQEAAQAHMRHVGDRIRHFIMAPQALRQHRKQEKETRGSQPPPLDKQTDAFEQVLAAVKEKTAQFDEKRPKG